MIEKTEDIIKQPTVLEFLGMEEKVICLRQGRNGLHMTKKIFMWI